MVNTHNTYPDHLQRSGYVTFRPVVTYPRLERRRVPFSSTDTTGPDPATQKTKRPTKDFFEMAGIKVISVTSRTLNTRSLRNATPGGDIDSATQDEPPPADRPTTTR